MLRFSRSRRRTRVPLPGEVALNDPLARDRAALFGVTAADVGVLATWRVPCTAVVAAAASSALARVRGEARLHPLISRYATSLFDGRIDADYVASRERIGRAHGNAGVEASSFLAASDALRDAFVRAIADAGANAGEREEMRDALERVMRFDAAIVLDAATTTRLSAAAAAHAAAHARDARAALEAREAEATPDTAQRFLAEAGDVLASLAARDLRPRLHGSYGPRLDAVKRAINQTIDDLERTMRAIGRVGGQVDAAAREIAAGAQSIAQGAAAQATALSQVAADVRDAGLTRTIEQIDALARRTAANAEAGATSASVLAEESAQLTRLTDAYTLRDEHSAAPHPRRRRTDVAPTEPVPQAPAEPRPGEMPTRFRKERRRSLFTDN